MLYRSGCNKVNLVYESPDYLPDKESYYDLFDNTENIFFVIRIGNSEVLYFWKKPTLICDMNIIANSFTDDCERITEYDMINTRSDNSSDYLRKLKVYREIKKKAVQTGVFIKGCSQEMPEPFTYETMDLISFPETMKESYISINMRLHEIFHAESTDSDGILSNMTVTQSEAFLNVGGIITKFNCTLYVFKAFNDDIFSKEDNILRS